MRLFFFYLNIVVTAISILFLLNSIWTLNDKPNKTLPLLEAVLKKNSKDIVADITQENKVEQFNTYPLNERLSVDNEPPLDNELNLQENNRFCSKDIFEDKSYIVCRSHPDKDKITLYLNDEHNQPFKRFYRLENTLNSQDKTIAFAMNAGMYHSDYAAVGLYIENGKQLYPISTKEGPGNFHMKPNGVFFINNGKAGVLDTDSFIAANLKPMLATQSGPMLVINNVLHPRFIPSSPFLEYRNGVGVTDDREVIFVISEQKVNFDELARFFRDQLKTPNALYLDGSISSIYAPELGRKDWWHGLGPIIGVIVDKIP